MTQRKQTLVDKPSFCKSLACRTGLLGFLRPSKVNEVLKLHNVVKSSNVSLYTGNITNIARLASLAVQILHKMQPLNLLELYIIQTVLRALGKADPSTITSLKVHSLHATAFIHIH